ncbi:MAG: serine/threonine-protein kinase [Acidobacteriia bacterium]|nr:serine/threonine-protein kinase [Terriglobia bacterium]
MQTEQRARIEAIFHAALERPLDERGGFLDSACAGDDAVRRGVESLLLQYENSDQQLNSTQTCAHPLQPGERFGIYEIQARLGVGGMGEVYRAQDTRLLRTVALKVIAIPLDRPADVARFHAEARALLSLNHPHIVTVYDFGEAGGRPFLVTELIDGETLYHRLKRGPIAPEEALRIAIEVSLALSATHQAGIVHRDIKPENIMLRPDGYVKLVDFGLAKSAESAGAPSLTEPGVAVGTYRYMSPEQLRGEPVDERTDVFSLGLVLYEMLAGNQARRALGPIDLSALDHLPEKLQMSVQRALEERREDRYASAEQMAADLVEARDLQIVASSSRTNRLPQLTPTSPAEPLPEATKRVKSALRLWILGAVAAILLGAVLLYQVWKTAGLFPASSPLPQPMHKQITFVGDATFPAISPDGESVAYVSGGEAPKQRLMLQDLKGGQAIELTSASRVFSPRWSPDGSELIARLSDSVASLKIVLIPRLGGPYRPIGTGAFASWSPDGRQIAKTFQNERGFRIVNPVTGSVKRIPLTGFQWFDDFDWSSSSNLLAALTNTKGRSAIWTVHPDGSQQRKVIEEDRLSSPRWSTAGNAIYFLHYKGDTVDLLKASINPKSGEARNPPSVLLSGLEVGTYFTLSRNATRLAYTRVQASSNLWSVQFDGSGKGKPPQARMLTTGTASHRSLSMSPDGKWIAFIIGTHIYKMPAQGGARLQLTFTDAAFVRSTAWSPDGKRIAFGSSEGGTARVWVVDADGANRRQFANTQLSDNYEITWSPGRHILYQQQGNQNFNVLDPDTGEERALLQDKPVGWILFTPRYSPDGKKVAVFWNRGPQSGLWVISLVDGSSTLVRSGDVFPIGWKPDSNSIYAFSPQTDSIQSIPAVGGVPFTISTLSGKIGEVIMSPDGRNFVSTVLEKKSDVWLMENFDPSHSK